MKKRRLNITTTHVILFSFLAAILLGTALLCLPISSSDGRAAPFVDALFTATTSTCVTGLVTVPTVSYWSTFGHVVILGLIQIGGLGVITVVSGFMLSMHRRMKLTDSLLLQDAFNLNTLAGLGRFVRKVIKGTFIVEGLGALLYMTVFIPEFGAKGIWISVFTSVSAFCNAGIDIIAENSLCNYAVNPVINLVTCALIVLGGIGFIVWWDIARVLRKIRRKKGFFKYLTLHSKITLVSTGVLIIFGAALIFVFEYNNPMTLREMPLFDKIQASFFQSVTCRTAGFATVAQENFTDSSAVVSVVLMFIGGSPVGTAGGVKTVTVAVLVATAVSAVKMQNEVSVFNRTLSKHAIQKAVGVVCTSFTIVLVSTVLLAVVTDASIMDIMYETVSATATVGLSRNLTTTFNTGAKFIIIAAMYFGRVGPISLAFAFRVKKVNKNIIKDPTEEISVG